jgi:hypothetical protein
VLGAVVVSGIIYVIGSYALVTAFWVGLATALAADTNPFHTAARAFVPVVPRHPQEHVAVGHHPGRRRHRAGHPDLG